MNNHMGKRGSYGVHEGGLYDLLQEALPQDRHRMTTSVVLIAMIYDSFPMLSI